MRPLAALKILASPRLTVLFFLSMAVAAVAAAHNAEYITAIVLTPLVLLLVNLAAAILSNARFRADLPLLLFHLALLAFLALLVTARLSYFDGLFKLTTGALFEGEYVQVEQGLLHGDGARRLRLASEGLTEHPSAMGGYAPTTFNQVRWWDSAGRPHMAEIGNDRPLVLDGYRIYATSKRGYAPLFRWQAASGETQTGAVQIDNGPMDMERGVMPALTHLGLPGGGRAWADLVVEDKTVYRGPRDNLGAATLKHHLVLGIGDKHHELRPGDTVELPGGRLTYLRLETWLGYRVTYDPTPPWLAATVFLGVASLLWFYARLWRIPRRGRAVEAMCT